MICYSGVPFTDAQHTKLAAWCKEHGRIYQKAENPVDKAAAKKELLAKLQGDDDGKALSVTAKKLQTMGFDVIAEMVDLYRDGDLKNNERIKILEILMEFSEQRQKASDPEGVGGVNIHVTVNTKVDAAPDVIQLADETRNQKLIDDVAQSE